MKTENQQVKIYFYLVRGSNAPLRHPDCQKSNQEEEEEEETWSAKMLTDFWILGLITSALYTMCIVYFLILNMFII